jgi:mono/diheme cytochrome c family protein
MSRLAVLGLLAVALPACPKAPPVQPAWDGGAPHSSVTPEPPPPAEPQAPPRNALGEQMHAQLEIVAKMRDAVVAGDRRAALGHAKELRHRIEVMEPAENARDHLEALSIAATLDPQSTLPDIGASVAHLAAACGACHASTGVRPALDDDPVPRVHDDLQSLMAAHRWASARMWEGLIGPDDDRWRRGTATFSALPGCTAQYPDALQDIRALCTHATRLVQQAHVADSAPSRTAIYGRLLATCASCHEIARPLAVRVP